MARTFNSQTGPNPPSAVVTARPVDRGTSASTLPRRTQAFLGSLHWVATVLALSLSGDFVAPAQAQQYEVVLSIPVGINDGITYAGLGGADALRWGPGALRIGIDGSLFIADTVAHRVLRITSDGTRRDVIGVPDAQAATDVAFDGVHVLVLDLASIEPTVYRLRPDGFVVQRLAVPASVIPSISGLALENGEVKFELNGGSAVSTLGGEVSRVRAASGQRYNFETLRSAERPTEAVLSVAGVRILISVENSLGAVNVVGTAPNGDIFVLVEEVSDTHILRVDQIVRRYSLRGDLLGMARVPLSERFTYVANGLAVAPNGDVLALVTRQDRADVVKLQFGPKVAPILPPPTGVGLGQDLEPRSSLIHPLASNCRSPDEMYVAATKYVDNRVYLSLQNLNGACVGRQKPRYLGTGAGEYRSVPYDWGGWASVEEFNQQMLNGRVAGDIDDANAEACSIGVDCSGFVSQAWATARYTASTDKYSTRTLPNVSKLITRSMLQRGDILNLADVHVAMFDGLSAGGVNTIEATTYNNYDRVVSLWNGWGRFDGYSAYRYAYVCETGPVNPTQDPDTRAHADMIRASARDSRFGVSSSSSFGSNPGWDSNWELRWLEFAFSNGRSVRIYHATYKRDSNIRYVIFWDPDRNGWSGWQQAS